MGDGVTAERLEVVWEEALWVPGLQEDTLQTHGAEGEDVQPQTAARGRGHFQREETHAHIHQQPEHSERPHALLNTLVMIT